MPINFADLAPKEVLTHFRVFIDSASDNIKEIGGDNEPLTSEEALGVEGAGGILGAKALHGFISSLEFPEIMFREISIPNHGDGTQFVDGGLENMNLKLSSTRYSAGFPSLLRRFATLKCYNAVRGREGDEYSLTTTRWQWEMRGIVRSVNPGTVEPGTNPAVFQFTMHVPYLKITHITEASPIVYLTAEIDTIRMKRIIAGFGQLPDGPSEDLKRKFDQLAQVRKALGLED